MNILSDNFWRMPEVFSQSVTRKELQDILLKTKGQIFACGQTWCIVPEHLGAGVYLVKLEAKVYEHPSCQ